MSAIFGLIRFDGGPVLKSEISSMSEAIAAHGGDGGSIKVHKNVGFGHLLRVITPEDRFERQPATNPGGSHELLFTGRLDNRSDLLAQLGPFESPQSEIPDSAIVSMAYERWGPACADRLCGDFVFLVWLEGVQRCVMVRAPLSNRTLFFHWKNRTLAFATSPLALFALDFVPKTLDRLRLADYVIQVPSDPGRSLYADVRMLEGGSIATVDRDGLKVETFWRPESLPDIRFKTDEEYVEAFLERFDQAVSARLRSDFPISIMMSGGIDSSAVACSAAPLLKKEGRLLLAFTQVPREGFNAAILDGFYADETPLVQAVAGKYPNIDLDLVRTEPRCALEGHRAFVEAGGAPFRNIINRGWYEEILSRAHSAGSRAILSGSLGNVAFSWNGTGVLSGMLRSGQFRAAFHHAKSLDANRPLRALLRQGILSVLPNPLWLAVKRYKAPDDPALNANPPWAAYSPLRRDYERGQRIKERARERRHSLVWRFDGDSRALRAQLLKENDSVSPEIMCGLEARHGLEERDPTADRRLVDFCLSIPESQFNRDGVTRRLPRIAMANRWPTEVALNRKRGMQSADWHVLLVETRPQLHAALDRLRTSPLSNEILDLERMGAVLDSIGDASSASVQTLHDGIDILYFGLGLGQFFEWIEAG